MREVPFMKASEVLERNNNLAKIHDQIRKLAPRQVFASKMHNRRIQDAMATRSQLKQTQPYDGAASMQSIGKEEPEQFTSQAAGRVTFKVKQKNQTSSISDTQNNTTLDKDKEKPSQGGRMLQNEEIREICEKHALSRGEVYQIRSQFASMCTMSEQMAMTATA